MSGDDENALASRAAAGDVEALHKLLEVYGPIVRDELRIDRRWRALLERDDVMQVSYLEAFLGIREFAPGPAGSFLNWLRRLANNNLRDAVRELQRLKRAPREPPAPLPASDDSYFALLELCGATTTTPSREAARGEARAIIEDALRELPPDYQQVIRLYGLNGRSAAEIAGVMGRSVGAIHLLRLRAYDRLRTVLGSGSRFFSGAP
ncbi:MAG TPA: sigma-70 family RNA polymerase sigma factor [Phycisphaerae bacterium]|jgi:RNA polymerase sigma-70 factor (ECF subfamily)